MDQNHGDRNIGGNMGVTWSWMVAGVCDCSRDETLRRQGFNL